MNGDARIRLDASGLILGERRVPLLGGSIHYYRLPRSHWRPALEELKSLGARFVDTYVPWSVHERGPGEFEFGKADSLLDVKGFLRQAGELGLLAVVRPGPHINGELTHFGIPERIIWDPDCQARSPRGRPVVLPTPPLCFPVPSYVSRAFQREACAWLGAVAAHLADLVWPNGPIVLCQVDNEAALYFRDGVYDQDYHPDGLDAYRRFLKARYKNLGALRTAYGNEGLTFDSITPPAALDAVEAKELAPHLDWAEFQEAFIEAALYRFRRALDEGGLRGVPMFHNLPIAEASTPLDPARLVRPLDALALDYYHRASPHARAEMARRTTELATRCAIMKTPAFAAELAAGFAAYLPSLTEADNEFVALTALAYGLRGFNVYMAVARDRWVGGPIDPAGRSRPSADFWQKLFLALERVRFHELSRPTEVCIVVPRLVRRLMRVLHAAGPVSPAAFALGEDGPAGGIFEENFGLDHSAALETAGFLRRLEGILDAECIPHCVASGDLFGAVVGRYRWVILISPGALDSSLTEAATRALSGSVALSVGPFLPTRDERFRETPARIVSPPNLTLPVELPRDEALLRQAVLDAAERLGVERLPASPGGVFTTLRVDAHGVPRVLFVINPGTEAQHVRVSGAGAEHAVNALTHEPVTRDGDRFSLDVRERSVVMLELSSGLRPGAHLD